MSEKRVDLYDDLDDAKAEANRRAESGEDQFVYNVYSYILGRDKYRVDSRNLLENCVYTIRGVDALYNAITEDTPQMLDVIDVDDSDSETGFDRRHVAARVYKDGGMSIAAVSLCGSVYDDDGPGWVAGRGVAREVSCVQCRERARRLGLE